MTSNTDRYREARDRLVTVISDYDKAIDTFAWPRIEGRFNWATDWFDVIARQNPGRNERTALWITEQDGSEQKISFAEMADRSDRVATWLADLGVSKGDRVILMLGNQVELWESMLAVAKLGAVIMPTTAALGPADVADRITRGGAGVVIANAADAGKFEGAADGVLRIVVGGELPGWHHYGDSASVESAGPFAACTDTTDPMLIYFTSGTTSKPKLVEHSQVSYAVGHMSTMAWIGVQPGDVHLAISSPGWAKHAWSSFFAPWLAEATIVAYNYTRFDAARFLRLLDHLDVTTLCAPPTVWRMLIQANLGDKPAKLREAMGAGEPLNPEVITQVAERWGITIRDGFGQTETTALIGNTPGAPVKPGSMGRPLPGVEAAVLARGPDGRAQVTDGEVRVIEDGAGELALRPGWPSMFRGYLHDDARYATAFAGGWYLTGDVARRDADGYFWFVARADDVIKSAGHLIGPFEVESVLMEHPAVAEAGVIGKPDPVAGEVVKAFVALKPGYEPGDALRRELTAFGRRRLGAVAPKEIAFDQDLPHTRSGKVMRRLLKARELGLPEGDVSTLEGTS